MWLIFFCVDRKCAEGQYVLETFYDYKFTLKVVCVCVCVCVSECVCVCVCVRLYMCISVSCKLCLKEGWSDFYNTYKDKSVFSASYYRFTILTKSGTSRARPACMTAVYSTSGANLFLLFVSKE